MTSRVSSGDLEQRLREATMELSLYVMDDRTQSWLTKAQADALLRRLNELEQALKQANGSLRKGDDPGGVWVHFPEDAWGTLYRAALSSEEARDADKEQK